MFEKLEKLVRDADYYSDKYYEAEAEDEEDNYLSLYDSTIESLISELMSILKLDEKTATHMAKYERRDLLNILSKRER